MLFLDLNIRKKVHQMEYPREELIISCEHILENSNEEPRLGVNTELAYVHAIVLKKLINYKTKVNCFNLVLHCGNQVMDMTGGYYVSSTIQE